MRVKNYLIITLAGCLSLLFSSCETSMLFKTEKKLKEQLIGLWAAVDVNNTGLSEKWSFTDDNKVYRTSNTTFSDTLNTGDFIVKTSFFSAPLIVTSGLDELFQLNGEWTIVNLDEETLTISRKPESGGLIVREFVKEL